MIGDRLGSYEITAKLGAGGMGEVWRATDTKLNRDVAIKVLPAALAQTPDRLSRFEREAKLLASLNHPGIATIHGVEEADGAPALVMELVEGPTLAERIAEGPFPVEEALAIARQIAEALDYAHGHGVIHRDLKPANVKLSPEGRIKLLDFGLAKAMSSESGLASGSMMANSPTLPQGATIEGTILGTAAYMAPEQAAGKAVDKRADIWAFGVVLYEMLSGVQPFARESVAEVLADVLRSEVDFAALPSALPGSVRRLLRHCLQKDPRRRLRDIGDARFELEELEADVQPEASAPGRPGEDVRIERLTDALGTIGWPALSPDGKMVAFVAMTGGRRQIWIRLLAGGTPLQVTRDDADHEEPRWLPDASAVIYYVPLAGEASGNVWQVSALGGMPRRIATATCSGDVSHDGQRLALFQCEGEEMMLVILSLNGSGTSSRLALAREHAYRSPRWSPDDRLLSFRSSSISFDTQLEVVSVSGASPSTVARVGWMRGHAWLPDGSGLVYSTSTGSTMAYPPTTNLRVVDRDGSRDRQLTFGDLSYFEPDVDPGGDLVSSRAASRSDVWRFPIEGSPAENVRNAERVTQQTGTIQAPAVSPDGRDLVYVSDNGGHSNLWLASVDGAGAQQITFEKDPSVTIAIPFWSPSGDRILFARAHSARVDVCLIQRDGSGFRTLIEDAFGACWSGDGRFVYCTRPGGRIDRLEVATGDLVTIRSDRAVAPALPQDDSVLYFARLSEESFGLWGRFEICRADLGGGPSETLAEIALSRVPLAPRIHLHPSLSPDGKWLAAPLIDSTSVNIWLIPTDGEAMRPITDFGERSVFIARWVSWSPDSRYVYAAVAENETDIVLLDGILG